MQWKTIRLELEPTQDFPRGSASRTYLLRLPLQEDGLIDRCAITSTPGQATVRRFWPNEPDASGYVRSTDDGWAFAYDLGRDCEERIVHHRASPIQLGGSLELTELDGRRLPFRVASLQALV